MQFYCLVLVLVLVFRGFWVFESWHKRVQPIDLRVTGQADAALCDQLMHPLHAGRQVVVLHHGGQHGSHQLQDAFQHDKAFQRLQKFDALCSG